MSRESHTKRSAHKNMKTTLRIIFGLSLLAISNPTYCDVIYSGLLNSKFVSNEFDLNSDGIADFLFSNLAIGTPEGGAESGYIHIRPRNENLIIAGTEYTAINEIIMVEDQLPLGYSWNNNLNGVPYFSTWNKSIIISPLSSGALPDTLLPIEPIESVRWEGPFGETRSSYVGVRFESDVGFHNGWVNISSTDTYGAQIVDWAYESSPDIGIIIGVIPEPSTVGLLGCSALYLLINTNKRKYG